MNQKFSRKTQISGSSTRGRDAYSDPPRSLEIRRGVELAPRGGGARGVADAVLLPRTPEQAFEALARARELAAGISRSVALGGAERSFESHFVPRDSAETRVLVSSKRLRGGIELFGSATSARGEPALRVRALAGTSFGELVRHVHATGAEFMPFSCPTAEAISLGGALAVNTHGRTSPTYGGLFARHVLGFRLVDVEGRVHDCRADAGSELERALFRYVPGALGALGLVTELELELCAISPRAEIVVEVLEARRADPEPLIRSYLEQVDHHRSDGWRTWSEGLSLIFLGPPSRGTSVLLGRRRGGHSEPRRSTLPLFRESAAANLFVQAFSHRFTEGAQGLAARLLSPGRSFRSSYLRWAFFQSSYDEACGRLERGAPLFWEALGLSPDLGLVHQGWVSNRAALAPFVALASDLLERAEYRSVASNLEFFDVLPLPEPEAPLDPSRAVDGGAHVVTLSVAVHSAGEREIARGFCRTLSELAFHGGLPLVVQLNKQHHVEPSILRAMHRTALDELGKLRSRVDPDSVLGSRTLERLGL